MPQRQNYAELARWLPWYDSVAGVEAWLAARETEPVASRMAFPLSIELGSEAAVNARKAYANTTRRNVPARRKKLTPTPAERIERVLGFSETKDPRFFLNLCNDLTLEDDSTHYGFEHFLTKTPGWIASESCRHEFSYCAKRGKFILPVICELPDLGTLPPAVERGFRQGGFVMPPGVSRADFRASFDKLEELVGALHKAGVPIVAGTDGTGMELVRELELYVAAGFTPAEALASATIETARLVGADAHTGSIAVGKAADLVLVDGDPSKHIGDLRHTQVVMMDGRPMDANALRAAGGFAGKPAFVD